jgi:isocitrate dehydrogenase kinase/phosphatase
MSRSDLAAIGAEVIHRGFESFQHGFDEITRRAEWRFASRDWNGVLVDAQERLDLYGSVLDGLVADPRLPQRPTEKSAWRRMKSLYSRRVESLPDLELAETFFNSVTRRVFSTVGVDPEIEFVASDFSPPPTMDESSICRVFAGSDPTRDPVREVLKAYTFAAAYRDLDGDAALVSAALGAHLRSARLAPRVDRIETLRPVFYRGHGAYIVGRAHCGATTLPFVLALLNSEEGVLVDAVLMSPDEVSILFSFTRSYFHVEVERHREMIHFLNSIMPRKPLSELYISIGYNKHGKTMLYRDLLAHLASSEDPFEPAPGDRGMVMIVFALPSYDVVFKIIRDGFILPKTTTRRQVEDRYRLVFTHDRAGRLVDAQEFEHLQFPANRFSKALLAELLHEAGRTVAQEEDRVVIGHLYAERRIHPLNLYLADSSGDAARDAVLDYGQAIKDLAAANIFPGDFLLKNFGVTRHGRVVFYDYDELCLLTDCRFRRLPEGRSHDEEMASEPWFSVGDSDVFPEEFERFLQLDGKLREEFLLRHADLFGVSFWRSMQERHHAGEVPEIPPYRAERRLRGA